MLRAFQKTMGKSQIQYAFTQSRNKLSGQKIR